MWAQKALSFTRVAANTTHAILLWAIFARTAIGAFGQTSKKNAIAHFTLGYAKPHEANATLLRADITKRL